MERGELPNEGGDVVKEFKALHGEDFWSSWLREDERGKEERKAKTVRKKEEKEERRTGKRRCEDFVSVKAFDIFGQGRDMEICGDVGA